MEDRIILWGSKRQNWGFPGNSTVKSLPASAGDTGDSGSIPWTEEAGGLQSIGSHSVGRDSELDETEHACKRQNEGKKFQITR